MPSRYTVVMTKGSSPLTRGKPAGALCRRMVWGLIPAHAGKTTRRGWSTRTSRAHPRSRGENRMVVIALSLTAGSSPLTRGKQASVFLGVAWSGLIPAHAGKTLLLVVGQGEGGAHPRSRGENVVAASSWGGRQGSSPLTRGKHSDGLGHLVADRLIPAHAGKTPCVNAGP